jgi:serine/threonine protein kinase
MTPERWHQVKQIFQSAIECPPDERAAFLARACAGDPELRSEVESLISSHDQAGDSIDAMAAEAATEMIADDQANPIIGKHIGHYKVLGRIGRGGMGEVFLAQDTKLGRKVALKLLRNEYTTDEDRLRRFQQEARAASALNHPNILTIHEIGQEGSLHFIATEYVEGETLREHAARARVTLSQMLDVAVQAATALGAAHQAGIVHRDIKPENLMLRTDGYVKVLDFGLAKLTESTAGSDTAAPTRLKVETEPGVVMGTVTYMSPEQARGLAVDARTDIWSLGAMMYEMAAGCRPFEGETASDVIALILQKEPLPLGHYAAEVPPDLERIVKTALRKDKEERYQTVKDLLIDVKSLRKELELKAEIERSSPPAPSRTTRRRQPTAPTTYGSSPGYIVNGIKQHRRATASALALVLAAPVALFFYFNRAKALTLTEKDTILVADIDNTTGDQVFDGTLKQALAIQLEQSPFLNILPEERVREALGYMGRSPDARVTKDLAREICQRQGIKAMLVGSISSLGSHYVVGLETIDGQTANVIAREQTEAESKEQVLKSLGGAATKLREKLGESLASIQKFDAPLEQATTPSLDALKAFTTGNELYFEASTPRQYYS